MASGELPWSIGEPLSRRLPGVEIVEVRGPDAAVVAVLRRNTPGGTPHRGQALAGYAGRDVVLVVRDPIRHAWQLDLVRFASVVVDVGWPTDLPAGVPVVRTRGIAPALLEAAAARLAGQQFFADADAEL
jgi:hypothetical protein